MSLPPDFSIQATTADGRTTLTATGEIDMGTVAEFAAAIRGALREGPVLLDLRGVQFMDSSGVRTINMVLKERAGNGHELRICREMHDSVRQIFELTGMLGVLPLEDCA